MLSSCTANNDTLRLNNMAPINTGHQTKPPHVSAAKALPFRDRVTKRPARGFLRFRSGILNVVPKGAERSM